MAVCPGCLLLFAITNPPPLADSSLHSCRMLGVCNVLAYVSAVCIFLMGLCPATTLVAVLLSAPEALSIARAFNPSWPPWIPFLRGKTSSKGSGERGGGSDRNGRERPYRLEGLVMRILKHSPGVVLAVFADTILREVMAAGTAAAAAVDDDGDGFGSSYWWAWSSGIAGVLFSRSLRVRCIPLVPFVYMFFLSSPPPRRSPPPSSATSTATEAATSTTAPEAKKQPAVVVAGGGVGGLVLGACLQELGLPFEVNKYDFRWWRGRGAWLDSSAGDAHENEFNWTNVVNFWRRLSPVDSRWIVGWNSSKRISY